MRLDAHSVLKHVYLNKPAIDLCHKCTTEHCLIETRQISCMEIGCLRALLYNVTSTYKWIVQAQQTHE